MDSGKSLNPAIDIGQVEGAFVMGLGQVLLEKVLFLFKVMIKPFSISFQSPETPSTTNDCVNCQVP